MDETNKDILRLLRYNGRMSFTEIGEEQELPRGVMKCVTRLNETKNVCNYLKGCENYAIS